VQIKNILLIMLAAFFLQACTSPKLSQELEGGKFQFSNGNYKVAFHQLLPLAAAGKKEAQYAVGYMYYYGLGVSRDSESGIFWMRQAANQDYAPAISALKMITEKEGNRY
jgi:TPR repeat protein